jgi:pimeloyl-ACP methyl ester carboxylesterase
MLLIIIFVIVSLLLAIVIPKYSRDLSAAKAAVDRIGSQVFNSSFGDMEYLLEGEGPVVLVSHGITGGIDQGKWITSTLGGGCRYLYVSRFGYLRTAMPEDPSPAKQAAAYVELLDHLGIDSVFVIGNSAGGTSLYHFAHDYPGRCRGMILQSSVVPGDTKPLPPRFVMQAVFGSDSIYWSSVRLFGTSMSRMFIPKEVIMSMSEEERKTMISRIYLSSLPISARTKGILFDMYVSNIAIDETFPFEEISVPSLVIHAKDDPAPPYSGAVLVSERIPGCRLVSVESGGHLMIGHEEEIRDAVREFVGQ